MRQQRRTLVHFACLALFLGASPASSAGPAESEGGAADEEQPIWPSMFPCPADVLGFTSRFAVLSDGSSVHYVERAPGSAVSTSLPPLVLVHGWPDSWRSWLRVLPLLPNDRRILALDQLGYGDSSKPDNNESYTIPNKAKQLGMFLDEVQVGPRIQLVGHSMGSFVAWEFAAQRPALVEALMLIGTAARGATPTVVQLGVVPTLGLKKASYAFMRDFQYSGFVDLAGAGPWFPPTTVYESLRAPLYVWKKGGMGVVNVTVAHAERTVPRITAPTLLVRGEADMLFSEAEHRRLLGLLTGAASAGLVSVPRAAHSVQWEEHGAGEVARLIREQLVNTTGGATAALAEPGPAAAMAALAAIGASAAAAWAGLAAVGARGRRLRGAEGPAPGYDRL